jgi:hypothetical protein
MITLPRRLPQTIEDAMHVTRSLGERYLWVDAFCIVQDNLADKHSQIIHMDAIYSSAFVTIVAASGSSSDSGLPGVSRSRNGHQVTEDIHGLRFSVPLPEYMSTVFDPDLVWNSRGWTFQEKILSKRLLVFTEDQVYFQCSNMVWCEDVIMETEGQLHSAEINWKPLRWAADRTPQDLGVNLQTVCDELLQPGPEPNIWEFFLQRGRKDIASHYVKRILRKMVTDDVSTDGGMLSRWANDRQMGKLALLAINRVPFGTYSAAIEEFTRRTLSKPADGINAVQGVLGTLTPRFGTFYAGLPQDLFGSALLWDPKCGITTEKYTVEDAPFASWSWARWNLPNGCVWSTMKPSRTLLSVQRIHRHPWRRHSRTGCIGTRTSKSRGSAENLVSIGQNTPNKSWPDAAPIFQQSQVPYWKTANMESIRH